MIAWKIVFFSLFYLQYMSLPVFVITYICIIDYFIDEHIDFPKYHWYFYRSKHNTQICLSLVTMCGADTHI